MKSLSTGKIWLLAAGQTLFIPQGRVLFGVFTVIGAITALGRVFDAVTDPWIASLSDRCESRLGHSQEERLTISMAISLTFIVGTAMAYVAPVVWGLLEPSMGRVTAMRMTFTLLAVIAFVCMQVPVFAIREKDYVNSRPAEGTAFSSLVKKFRNKEFCIFVGSDIFYWIGLTMFQSVIPPVVQGFILVAAAAFPMAIFGILPQAMVADISESDSKKPERTGRVCFMQPVHSLLSWGRVFPCCCLQHWRRLAAAGTATGQWQAHPVCLH